MKHGKHRPILVAVDPQVHGLGVATFDLSGWSPVLKHPRAPLVEPPPLLRLAYLTLTAAPKVPDFGAVDSGALAKTHVLAPRRLALTLRDWVGDAFVKFLVVEGQQRDGRNIRPMDLVNLARVSGAVSSALDGAVEPPVVLVPTPLWTRGMSKDKRLKGAVLEYKRRFGVDLAALVELQGRAKKKDDALDAYCLGLWGARKIAGGVG